MAKKKRKRNKSKKNKFVASKNKPTVSNSASNAVAAQSTQPNTLPKNDSASVKPAESSKPNKQTSEHLDIPSEVSDAKFSLILFLVIVAVFVGIYFLMQNQSVSNFLYGLIKIDNIAK